MVMCWPWRAQLRRGPDGGGNGNVATTLVLRLNSEVDELEEATVELWVSWRQRISGGEGARRQHCSVAMAEAVAVAAHAAGREGE